MSEIQVTDLRKTFRVHEGEAGAKASLKSLFVRRYKKSRRSAA